jgi:hypothetical protein
MWGRRRQCVPEVRTYPTAYYPNKLCIPLHPMPLFHIQEKYRKNNLRLTTAPADVQLQVVFVLKLSNVASFHKTKACLLNEC